MAILNETQLVGNMKVNLPAYTTWSRNRTDKGGGGIATAVHQQYSATAVGIGEGEDGGVIPNARGDSCKPRGKKLQISECKLWISEG